jgi:signal transduction histidine kinase
MPNKREEPRVEGASCCSSEGSLGPATGANVHHSAATLPSLPESAPCERELVGAVEGHIGLVALLRGEAVLALSDPLSRRVTPSASPIRDLAALSARLCEPQESAALLAGLRAPQPEGPIPFLAADGATLVALAGAPGPGGAWLLTLQPPGAGEADDLQALVAGLVHDYNNLLMVLSGALFTTLGADLGRRPALLEEAERMLERARSLCQTLSGRRPAREELALTALAARVCELFALAHPEQRLRCSLEEGLRVTADAARVEHALLNLLLNAAHAAGPGGTIQVRLDRIDPEQCAQDTGGALAIACARLSVLDDGPGVPAPLRECIFEPYFTTRPAGVGSGLGLAAVDRLARDLGGIVRVDSAPGGGAAFSLFLPTPPGELSSGGSR